MDEFGNYGLMQPQLHLPSARDIQTDIQSKLLGEMYDLNSNAAANLASEFCKRLEIWIRSFEASLDDQHEVGVRLVSFGQATVFHLQEVASYDPSLIAFRGYTDKDEPVELIQHVSQISILLMKLSRIDLSAPKRQIGFSSEPERSGEDDEDESSG